MTGALTSGLMSPEIRKVVDRARREPEGRFHSLAHLLDVPALAAAYWSIRKDAAVGVDGVTKDQYGQDLERNFQDLYARLRSKRYRHQPIRRVHIPKDGGRTRPIGISALEDKIVQSAVRRGGSGRVGPLAGWYRLRLLREILDVPVAATEKYPDEI